jgi:ribose 5-phosphate isomerase B
MNTDSTTIEALVREVVTRTLGLDEAATTAVAGPTLAQDVGPQPARPILDEEAARRLPANTPFHVPPHMLVTPLARQVAMERRIKLIDQADSDPVLAPAVNWRRDARHKVALGADHGGFGLKDRLKSVVETAGYAAVDCGTHSAEAVDYPDYAYAVARLVANGQAWRGIIIDGAGIGSCMAANKVPGVRAALCYDQATAVNSREHNNANVLTLGAGLIGPNLAGQIVTTWLATEFAGGRHARRVAKIDALDKRYR